MKKVRAIMIGAIIWALGVSFFTLSFFLNIMEDAQLQANLVLFITVIPLVWMGSRAYYKKQSRTPGYLVGSMFFLVAGILDALITVPLLVLPTGGTYYDFFMDMGFWIIGVEFIATATLYWFTKIHRKYQATV